jgi:ABC-type nitrate/sulfonate/bicarbonate transport system substrate-binding protein
MVVKAEADSRIKNNHDETKKVLRATVRGLRFMHERKEEIIPVMSRWLNRSQEVARDSDDLILPSFSLDGGTVNKTYGAGVRPEF